MRVVTGWMVMGMMGCAPASNGWVTPTAPTSAPAASSFDSELFWAETQVLNTGLEGLETVQVSPRGELIFLDLGSHTESMNARGVVEAPIDASARPSHLWLTEEEREDLQAFQASFDVVDERPVGFGDLTGGWVATDRSLHCLDMDEDDAQHYDLADVVRVQEDGASVYVLQADGSLHEMVDGDVARTTSLDGTTGEMSRWEGYTLVAGDPVWAVDAEGVAEPMPLVADRVDADPAFGRLLTSDDRGFTVHDVDLEVLWSAEPVGFQRAGLLRARDVVWVHAKSAQANRVTLYDVETGDELGHWELAPERSMVSASEDGYSFVFADEGAVEMWTLR